VSCGLPSCNALADEILNHPVAEEKGEYTGKGKDPPKVIYSLTLKSITVTVLSRLEPFERIRIMALTLGE